MADDNNSGRGAKILPFNRRETRNSDEGVLPTKSSILGAELDFGKEIMANKEKAEKLAAERLRKNRDVLKSYRMKK